jgi:anti-sigma regulatory factor (Ser/Thr protein kinase)
MADVVRLTIPSGADLLVLARLTAATVASRAGFDVEEVEDLRLAVDELCVALIRPGTDGTLTLEFTRDADLIEVRCSYEVVETAPAAEADDDLIEGLSDRILDALVDEHGRAPVDGNEQAWLRKRRARQQA